MSKILITGGAGFIGSNIARYFLKKGHQVAVLDNFSTGTTANLAGLDLVTVTKGDVLDEERLKRSVAGAEIVLHHAAWRAVGRSVDDPLEAHKVNLTGTLRVLEASRRAGVKKVVLASSSAVYGDKSGVMAETDRLNPISAYAAAKAAAEMYGQVYQRQYALDVVSLRYFNVYGEGSRREAMYPLVVPALTEKLMKGEPPEIHGTGEQRRDFIHVSDVARAVWLAAKKTGARGKVFNIGSGQAVSVNEVLAILQEVCGTSLQPLYLPLREGDVALTRAEVELARKELGFVARKRLREGLNEYCRWWRENQRVEARVSSARI